jgi:hypothetical protein
MLLPQTTFLHKPHHYRQRGRHDSRDSSLKGLCVDERARATNKENTADTMENRRRNHRLARQQVVCLASGVSPRRSDEGYEMANSSMAVVPSNPCSVRGAGGAHDEIRGRTTHTNNLPGILGAGGVPSLVDKVVDERPIRLPVGPGSSFCHQPAGEIASVKHPPG